MVNWRLEIKKGNVGRWDALEAFAHSFQEIGIGLGL